MAHSFKLFPYKVLLVKEGGYVYLKGYSLFEYDTANEEIQRKGTIPDKKYALLSRFKLLRRFFRAEITGLYELSDGSLIAIAKKALFRLKKGEDKWEKCFTIPRGSKPLNLCILPNGHIFFGEYFMNMEKKSVRVFRSLDDGDTWEVAYTFEDGNINHIHGLFHDWYTGRIWCLTGDRENECIIGYTEDEFASFHEVLRGGQEYRSCQLFFYPDYMVYATDSQYMPNVIKKIDRRTLEITELQSIQGSAIKGGQAGDVAFISTTIEPSEVNKDHYAHVWVTRNGLEWKEIVSAKKDSWPAIMQFGTFEFPQYVSSIDDSLYLSGRALCKVDGRSLAVKL